ncbi:tryptophan--tRNA ligase, mitochondrial isoform X2 [Cryptotermes secundus]|uniref:tryptophan--tRNA ligase, mitochondrial isoform X2 n=1 Tax=Cryptotermes secundus TaxID=105785 RepID=UPI000CD7D476|nr:tryptophan--tRNA ligase, mitochondrial isoform X2 [Cryptotermes secundus]
MVLTVGRRLHILNEYSSRCLKQVRRSHATETFKWSHRVFSGIQPTGSMHLGNYFGAVQKWVEMQNAGESVIYSIADLHSITLPQIPEHTQLCWTLGCLTTMARLAHIPTYKEKSATVKEVPLGLYVYPVLQAADILLYRATHVPVGEDQTHNLELVQHLAKIFNNRYGHTFPIPKAVVADSSISRLKSLRDPSKKMSKSEQDPKSRIEITDTPDDILEKCKKALTDFTSEITFDPEKRPGVANLITIHSLFTGLDPAEICEQNIGLDTGRYKLVVAEVIQEKLEPLRQQVQQYMSEPQYIEEVLNRGADKASVIAQQTWLDVKTKVGLQINEGSYRCLQVSEKRVM